MNFNGSYSDGNPDMIRANMIIRLNGLNAEQQEIQRYQDCYHGRLFEPRGGIARNFPWGTKWDPAGNSVSETRWKPLYVSSLAKRIVAAHDSALFSEDSFPDLLVESWSSDIFPDLQYTIEEGEDNAAARTRATTAMLARLVTVIKSHLNLPLLASQASCDGLVQGRVPVIYGLWEGELCGEILDRKWCVITYHPKNPKRIIAIREQYIYEAESSAGNKVAYAYRREITENDWFEWSRKLESEEQIPEEFSDQDLKVHEPHDLGFCPVVLWSTPDGRSIFADEVTGNIEGFIRYDNNIKKSLDGNLSPQRYVLRRPGNSVEDYAADDGLEAEEEIADGAISSASDEPLKSGTLWPLYGDSVGDFSTNGSHGEARQDKKETAWEIMEACGVVTIPDQNDQSGKALGLRLRPQKGFVSKLRSSFGNTGMSPSIRMCIDLMSIAIERGQTVKIPPGVLIPKRLESNEYVVTLGWGEVFPPDEAEKGEAITNANQARGTLVSQETATRYVASYFGVNDIEAELEKMATEKAESEAIFAQSQNSIFNGLKKQ